MKTLLLQLSYLLLVHVSLISNDSRKPSLTPYRQKDILEKASFFYAKQALKEYNITLDPSLIKFHTTEEHFLGAARLLFISGIRKEKNSYGSPLLWAILYEDKKSVIGILKRCKPSIKEIEQEDLIKFAQSKKDYAESSQQKSDTQYIAHGLKFYKKFHSNL